MIHTRDSQFSGFAVMELKELDEAISRATKRAAQESSFDEKTFEREVAQALGMILARRAYDLVSHTIGYTLEYLSECGIEMPGGMCKRILPSLPDLPVLPEEQIE